MWYINICTYAYIYIFEITKSKNIPKNFQLKYCIAVKFVTTILIFISMQRI